MKKKICCSIFILTFVFVRTIIAHDQAMHQYLTREAFNLLQMSFPGQLSEMSSYLGTNEEDNTDNVRSFGSFKIVSGAWIEDEYDIVYHYGIGADPVYNQSMPVNLLMEIYDIFDEGEVRRAAHTCITHFWNADNGENASTFLNDNTNLIILPYWSFSINKNAYQKIALYKNGGYDFRHLYHSWTNVPGLYLTCLGWDGNYQSLVDLYQNGNYKIVSYLGVDLSWHPISNYPWVQMGTATRKGYAYEILGRMCHLLQDMSVPAHVHCTSHAGTGGMYSDYYENNASNFYMWTADEIYNQGDQFICPYNSVNDPIFYLMYFMNQIADYYADGKHNGDNNYDVNIPGLADIIPYLGAPSNTSEINESNCQSMHDVLMPYAIKTTAGLLYWFGIETGTLVDGPPAIPQNFTGTWYDNHPKVYWTASSEPDFKEYEVWKKRDSGSWNLRYHGPNTYYIDYSEFKWTKPQPSSILYYKACAVDNADQKSEFTSQKTFTVNAPQQSKGIIGGMTVSLDPVPSDYQLYPAFPNPFNATTTLKLDLPEKTIFSLIIYDIKGSEVWSLNNRYTNSYPAGYHTIIWNGTDNNGSNLPTGLYLIVFNSSDYKMNQKLVLVK